MAIKFATKPVWALSQFTNQFFDLKLAYCVLFFLSLVVAHLLYRNLSIF